MSLFNHIRGFFNKRVDRSYVFDLFPAYSGFIEEGFFIDFLGTKTANEFVGKPSVPRPNKAISAARPRPHEEYFEWMDILESVLNARKNGSYVFIELGAGYGRWSAIALKAAEAQGIKSSCAVLVEAEPQHAAWAYQHMSENDFPQSRYHIIEAGIGNAKGREQFFVMSPDKLTPDKWYGQTLVSSAGMSHQEAVGGEYFGRPLFIGKNGWGAIEIDVVSLQDVLDRIPMSGESIVDLIDMDIQGSEAQLVEANIELLSRTVRRVHIGTHSTRIETKLRQIFRKAKWESIWDFPCGATAGTPYGKISFGDGVQSWVNPRLKN